MLKNLIGYKCTRIQQKTLEANIDLLGYAKYASKNKFVENQKP